MATATKKQFTVVHRFARISPRKVRLILDLIRGKNVNKALEILSFQPQRAAAFTKKLLSSAINNAENAGIDPVKNISVDVDNLKIVKALADGGPIIKRWRPVGMGRAFPIRRRTAHITLVLEQAEEEQKKTRGGEKVKRAAPDKSAKSGSGEKKTKKKSSKKGAE